MLGVNCIFLRQVRRFSAGAQLYVKPPQLRRNGTVIKVSNLRVPKEQTWCTFSGLHSV
jgi:hypothetical protein